MSVLDAKGHYRWRHDEENALGDTDQNPLRESVENALKDYFDDLQGQPAKELYDLVLSEVEEPMLKVVMSKAGNNQSRAAAMLGLNRGTLRKKLKRYGLI